MLPIQDVGKDASQAQVGGWELAGFEEEAFGVFPIAKEGKQCLLGLN